MASGGGASGGGVSGYSGGAWGQSGLVEVGLELSSWWRWI